jgi:hypothetical protein
MYTVLRPRAAALWKKGNIRAAAAAAARKKDVKIALIGIALLDYFTVAVLWSAN